MSNPIKDLIRNARRALNFTGLYEKDVSADPFEQFEKWMNDAVEKEPFEPNAMTLATASKNGQTGARTVLLKDYGPEGFVFYTNFNSRKGRDLYQNPNASIVFYWGSLSRQVMIDGTVEKISREQSEDYFHSRPRASQIAAYASAQSEAVISREELQSQFQTVEDQFKDQEIPCPEHWGGMILKPTRIEFWQGRPDRMHDRLAYKKIAEGNWDRQRLAP